MSSVRVPPNVQSALVTVALLGILMFVLLVCATEAYASFRLEYVEGVKPTDGIAVTGRSTPEVALGRTGYPLTTGRATFTPAPPAPTNAIPWAIIDCESGGDYKAENPRSSASGKYQFIDSTWDSMDGVKDGQYRGYSHASHAPPHIQDEAAVKLWDGGAGRGHWDC